MLLDTPLKPVLIDPIINPLGLIDPAQLPGLVQWNRFNKGITITGAGVSQWDDASGLDHHFLQAVDANRMTQAGDGSVLGNGVDQFLKTAAYTLAQPETFYVLYKTIADTAGYIITDGNVNDSALIYEEIHPNIRIFAGAVGPITTGPATGTYFVATAVLNGASSSITVNNETPSAGNAGATGAGGLTLGSNAAGTAGFANIQVKEVIVYNTAHDAATKARLVKYLANVGGLSI